MGWFKDFFFADRDEEYEKTEVAKPKKEAKPAPQIQLAPTTKTKKPIETKQQKIQPAKQKREIQAKVVYQYPKGEFRFPLIPDGGQQVTTNTALHSEPKQVTPKRNTQRVIEKNNVPIMEKKRPFKLTDVPSPVFAFQKRPSRFEFDITKELETGEPILDEVLMGEVSEAHPETTVVPEVEEEITVSDQIEEPALVKDDIEVLEEELPEAVFEEAFVEVEDVSLSEVEELAILEQIKDADVIADEEIAVAPVEEVEPKAERIELIHEAPKPEKPVRTNTPPKTRIPFNVMMVNQDKQRVEKKEEVEQQPVNTTFETPKEAEIAPVFPVEKATTDKPSSYYFPSLTLLKPPVFENEDEEWLAFQEELLNETLLNFNVAAKVVNVTQGPAVTRFEVQPEKGVKVSKITNLTDDIKLNLAAKDIRIEAPIPGKSTIGIEIPNATSRPVMLSEIMNSQAFQMSKSPLTAALGLDISGRPIVTDLQTMPHGLIAGATGSGKSVCINSLLISLLYKATPDELKLLLIDPKMVELAPYNRIPHLVSPVITDAKAATAALKWAVEEMERRYQLFAHAGVRNMEKFNEYSSHPEHSGEKLPYILIIIDELADLMMVAPSDVEEAISRIAQKARACGIHMIVATQRPSVDVITGLIKANIPTRVSFSVSSQIDSRTIIDTAGAEKLLGKGDMLFLPSGASKPVRLQGTYVGDQEIDAVIAHVRNQGEPNYLFKQEELLEREIAKEEEDDLFDEACDFVLGQNGASTSLLQRHFRIGYNRAARLMEALEKHNIVSATNGSRPRDVIITREQLEKIRDN
ncbi:DNA translocase FtsK [Listeria weihenstephanensis]|uniref:DNA translocase FtsK n=1 Tax=Listeria weihenstephanensis TaxID=1006155 RepID=A0A841Z886_9LIST|nr:DNA translocase FtsK [Listeria weihenstephanensis]MBC1500852.1 DNA translocase FtsK [Listeria weihenstephanensis]